MYLLVRRGIRQKRLPNTTEVYFVYGDGIGFSKTIKTLHRSIYCCSAHENRPPALCSAYRKRRFNRWRGIADDLVVMRSFHRSPPVEAIAQLNVAR